MASRTARTLDADQPGSRAPHDDRDKLRGGYYTPPELADQLAAWAVADGARRVLEPSAGDGAFVRALARHVAPGAHVDAVELFPSEAAKIGSDASATVSSGDVFAWFARTRPEPYDAVVGNPPFIRYQKFPEEHRAAGFALMNDEGLRPNRLTNAWVPFVVLATKALRPGGRLAMVLPAELLQVTYAGELRSYLVRQYSHLTVMTFRRLVFSGIQQETVLVMGTKRTVDDPLPGTMSFVELDTAADLTGTVAREPVLVDLEHDREKWTQYYLSPSELGLLREIEISDAFTTLGELASVDVGVVTGRNEFFVLTPSQADARGVRDHCLRLVGRSAQIPGLVLRDAEWEALVEGDGRCLLLQLGRTPRPELSLLALAYVEEGEERGHHEGYKCRIRLPEWWYVPSTHVPDAFLLRQIHDGPRIIVNEAGATSTDTIHRVRTEPGVDPGWLAAASMNSVTFAFSEVRGRSYGGGVLELEPNEADGLPFPKPNGTPLPLADLDLWARRKDAEQVLTEVDRLVLLTAGLSASEIDLVRGVWRKLSARRAGRKRR
ncbi:MAG TPA: class I SAM-dependent methyltransferase [Iamia sp.]